VIRPSVRRRVSVCAASALAGLVALMPAAEAQSPFPNRPIRLVVGFPAGGPTDGPARIIADKLRNSLGQPVVVENKPGAGGAIAVADVLAQPRDGYSLLLCTYIDPINTVLLKSVSYKLENLQPISQITKAYYGLAVPNNLPVNSIAEFIAYAKTRPGQLNYGHVGVGSAPELIAREFELLTGIKMTGVPFRGTAPALQEMVAGRLDFLVGPLVVTMPLFEAKQIKLLAMTSPERLAVAPDVPTLTEQAVKLVSYGWLGVCGGSGLPRDIVELLNRHVRDAVASPEYEALMKQTGVIGVSNSPEEFGKVIVQTAGDARSLAAKLGIEPN
jgi:tripartite-type tricarboxylate transporter receptor subunit TctC